MTAQLRLELDRVATGIGATILAFCAAHPRFRMEDLRREVVAAHGTSAPDSAGRILRDLRRRGMVRYRVIDRAASLYEMER